MIRVLCISTGFVGSHNIFVEEKSIRQCFNRNYDRLTIGWFVLAAHTFWMWRGRVTACVFGEVFAVNVRIEIE